MAIFRYEATEPKSGLTQRGAMEASTAQEVSERLAERGYLRVQVINPVQTATTVAASRPLSEPAPSAGFSLMPAVSPKDLGVFFRQLASLIHAGFTPGSALVDLAPRTRNRALSSAAQAIGSATLNGASFAAGVAQYPAVFPAHMAGLLAAGETGGFIEFACEEIALGAEGDAALRQGLWLPKLLIWQSIWSVLLLQPLAMNLTLMFKTGMPGLIKAGHDLLFIFIPLGIALHILAEIGGLWWRQPFFASARDRMYLYLPVMRKLAHMRAVAAFTRMLRRLLLAGISPEPAFVASVRAVPNSALREELMQGVPVLRAGNGLDAAIQATGMFEHDPLQMLITGQKTGQWTEMLDRITAYYQEQAAKATEDAKGAQKRLGVILTIVSMGYVTIVLTAAPLQSGMQALDDWTK